MIPFLILDKIKAKFGNELILPDYINKLVPTKEAWQGSEHDLQKNYFAWLATLLLIHPELMLAHAIPNGGKRDKITAANLKAEGVKSGIPDVFLPIPKMCVRGLDHVYTDCHGLYIEFKRAGQKPEEEQRAYALMLDEQGYKVIVTNCLDMAKNITLNYLAS